MLLAVGVGCEHWLGPSPIWHPLAASDQGDPDIGELGNLRAVQLLLGHARIESTVRYPGIEVDDALATAEWVDV
jgi:hypothetical protein